MSKATDTLSLYKAGWLHKVTSDTLTDGVVRELAMESNDYESRPDWGDWGTVVNVADLPAILKRTKAPWLFAYVDNGNFLSWSSFATEALAREAMAIEFPNDEEGDES